MFLQFSVTEHFRTADVGRLQSLPGVFFFYDLSPIKVFFSYLYLYCIITIALWVVVQIWNIKLMTATKLFYTVFFPKKILNQFLFSFFMPLIFSLYWNCILQVTFTEEHVSFLHFLTNVCAIVGGMQMDRWINLYLSSVLLGWLE